MTGLANWLNRGATGVQKRERHSESHWQNVSPPDLQSLLPMENFNKTSREQVFFTVFYYSKYPPAQGGRDGEKKERTNAKYLHKVTPDSYNLHDPLRILHNAGEISSLSS